MCIRVDLVRIRYRRPVRPSPAETHIEGGPTTPSRGTLQECPRRGARSPSWTHTHGSLSKVESQPSTKARMATPLNIWHPGMTSTQRHIAANNFCRSSVGRSAIGFRVGIPSRSISERRLTPAPLLWFITASSAQAARLVRVHQPSPLPQPAFPWTPSTDGSFLGTL